MVVGGTKEHRVHMADSNGWEGSTGVARLCANEFGNHVSFISIYGSGNDGSLVLSERRGFAQCILVKQC